MPTTNTTKQEISEMKAEVEKLTSKLDAFIDQYELDMRGDKELEDGNSGLVGALRELKKYTKEYPSITYLLAKHPFSTIAIILSSWLLVATLYDFGLLRILAKVFGLDIP